MKAKRTLISVLFALYALVMLYLMIFGRIKAVCFEDYWQHVSSHVSFVPLRFIFDYVKSVDTIGAYNIFLRNIIGNTVLFVPLGIFLPCCFPNMRKYLHLLLATAIIIFVLEAIQLFSTLGSFDVDDIILNCIGASAGFAVFTLYNRHKKL